MAEKIATRAAYGNALVELAEKYPELVVFDADLAGATMTKGFMKAYPDRFFDMGIAECNMVGVAAGLSTCGKKPFVNTFAMFAAGRAWEQVRNTVCYPRLNVKVIGSHGGLSVGEDGATHQCIEDFAIMRAIPGMTVLCPCDGNEMRLATEALLNYEGPAYMRMGRADFPVVTSEDDVFEIGKARVMREGSDVTLFGCGQMTAMCLEAAETLASEGVSAEVVNVSTIKPIDAEAIVASVSKTGCCVTAEEHSIIGGLGSAVAEVLADSRPAPLERVGTRDTFGESGKPDELMIKYGLTAGAIADAARKVISRK